MMLTLKPHPTKEVTKSRRARKSARNTVYAFNATLKKLARKAARTARREV